MADHMNQPADADLTGAGLTGAGPTRVASFDDVASLHDDPWRDPGQVAASPDRPSRPDRPSISDDDWSFYERWFSVLVVGGLMLFVFIHLHPSQIFANTTPSGGDLGAHVWAPAYLRDHILPHWRLSGWSHDWYAGFPMYRYYMVVPALIALVFDVVLPYGIALKITTVLGLITLPFTTWAFGRAVRLPRPVPEVFAAAATWFLFDETFRIYGGNIASTMAGEFSFSIALSLAFGFFAALAHSLRTGRRRVLAGVLCALACLSHGIVIFFVAAGGLFLVAVHLTPKRLGLGAQIGAIGVLLQSFWVVPFVLGRGYLTDMFYERRPTGKTPDDRRPDSYWEMFFPQSRLWDRLIMITAILGLVIALRRRHRGAVWCALMAILFATWAYVQPQSILWNARLLPFMYLCRYMLAAYGIVMVGRFVIERMWTATTADVRRIAVMGIAGATALTTAFWITFHLWDLVGGQQRYDATSKQWVYEWPKWGPLKFTGVDTDKGISTGWARWDLEGYEKKAAYGEYHDVVSTMKTIGTERGCGRAMWENNNDQDKYGTPMALMLLPFWTDGCIGSMEGLYFEASGTTPYHFVATSAMSAHSSNPVRRLRYEDGQVTKGVEYLKTLGVRYYLAYNDSVTEQADRNSDLELVTQSGPWKIYEVIDHALVVPLTHQPIVSPESGLSRDQWLELGMSWFQNQALWPAVPVADGPAGWQRVGLKVTSDHTTDDRNLAVVFPEGTVNSAELAPVAVSNVVTGDNSISFDVDKVGIPVLVRVSAFPSWKATGATGPYRAAPNFMVVVPTSNHVELNFTHSGTDLGAYSLTAIGLLLALFLWRRGPVRLDPLYDETEPLLPAAALSMGWAESEALLTTWVSADDSRLPPPAADSWYDDKLPGF